MKITFVFLPFPIGTLLHMPSLGVVMGRPGEGTRLSGATLALIFRSLPVYLNNFSGFPSKDCL